MRLGLEGLMNKESKKAANEDAYYMNRLSYRFLILGDLLQRQRQRQR